MIEEKTERLMWQKLDGSITPEEESRLEAVLKRDAMAKEYYDELLRFSELLGGVEELEPPTALRERIEGAIDFDRRDARGQSTGGFVIGMVAYHLATYRPTPDGSIDPRDLVGSINRVDGAFEIDLDAVQGTIDFRQEHTQAISEIEITSGREIELYLEYDGHPVQFAAVGNTDSPLHDISVADDSLVLKSLGLVHYTATFTREDGAPAPLRVRIISEGEVLLDQEIQPHRLR
jgi:hypothetical protein